MFEKIKWCSDSYEAARGANAVVILTEWNEFRALSLDKLSSKMKTSIMVDLRNIYSKAQALNSGFLKYVAVGR